MSSTERELNLKHRLTGAVILIGAAVVGVSLLLVRDRPGATVPVDTRIDADAFLSEVADDAPPTSEPATASRDAGGEHAVPAPEPGSGNAAPEAAPAGSGETGQWMVQVGVYGGRKNAEQMTANLKKKGYEANQSRITSAAGEAQTRVWAGPYPSREEAMRAKSSIDADFKLEGLVRKLQP